MKTSLITDKKGVAFLAALWGYLMAALTAIITLLIPTTTEGVLLTGAAYLVPESNEICYQEDFCIEPKVTGDYLTGDFVIRGEIEDGDYELQIDAGQQDAVKCNLPKGAHDAYNLKCDVKRLKLDNVDFRIVKGGVVLPLSVRSGNQLKNLAVKAGKCLLAKKVASCSIK